MPEHFKSKFEVELKYRLKAKLQFLIILKSIIHEIMV